MNPAKPEKPEVVKRACEEKTLNHEELIDENLLAKEIIHQSHVALEEQGRKSQEEGEANACKQQQQEHSLEQDDQENAAVKKETKGVSLMQEPSKDIINKEKSRSQLSDPLSATLQSFIGDIPPLQNITSPCDLSHIQTDPSKSSECVSQQNILAYLGLNDYYPKKLSLKQMLYISHDKLNDVKPTGPKGIPWHFLYRVLMSNSTARNLDWPITSQLEDLEDINEDSSDLFEDIDGINPLDVIVAILLCSDHILRQELMLKMSLCQFGLPLLLPEGDNVTFLLWAMRSIIKQWRPQSLVGSSGFVEENIVTAALPIFSFIRLGPCTVSKSQILNLTLSRTEHQQNFFLHSQMEYGNLPRKISDGLAEICWYLPGGNPNLDILPEACSFINLRGEAKAHQEQAQFLANVSNALFVFVDVIGEGERQFLTSLAQSRTQFFLIINSSRKEQKNYQQEDSEFLKSLNVQQEQLLGRKGKNDAQLVEILRFKIKNLLTSGATGRLRLEEMPEVASRSGIQVDENNSEIKKGKKLADNILKGIGTRDIAGYKQTALYLQGELWQTWSKAEKEKSRMKHREDRSTENYMQQLEEKQTEIRQTQREKGVSEQMNQFIAALTESSGGEQGYSLQWLKLDLNRKSRQIVLCLDSEYKQLHETLKQSESKQTHKNIKKPSAELNKLDQRIAESSLGLEHFMRELGQIYEIFAAPGCQVIRENLFRTLPGVAADLMLGGFPLELIDGDVSNIPMQWVSAVLNEVDRMVGGNPRIFVLTVLGVQSTGKSTLLNTMFGLQFAVSSGRCTRGAYMQLIKLTGDLVTEVGCDFILVIDTEGLKAAELMSLEGSYEHDNELATLVIGLSDVTLVNMSMENSADMKDILQIVVHSFLRMRESGKKPICQLVHQNVAGVSAYDQNKRDRKKLLEQLDKMTLAAARMEKSDRIRFCDVMDYDTKENNWYIPGLWHGVPPMAAVSTGYSEHVSKLKKSIFDCFSNRNKLQNALTIPDFIKWMSGLWDQIKYENFIFSFQNSLFAEAYKQLSRKYSEWDLELRTCAHNWTIEAENRIKNTNMKEALYQLENKLNLEITTKMEAKKNEMFGKLKEYFESKDNNVHLMESYREKFQLSIQFLCIQLTNESIQKCNGIITISVALVEVDQIWADYNKQIEDEVMKLLNHCKKGGKEMNSTELQNQFEVMWASTLGKLKYQPAKETDIEADIELHLRNHKPEQTKEINQALTEKSISESGLKMFDVAYQNIDQNLALQALKSFFKIPTGAKQANILSTLLEKQCKQHTDKIIKMDMDYDSSYCLELLWDCDKKIENISDPIKISEIYKARFKLHMCGYAARRFKAMHKAFVDKHNPQKRLQNMKDKYFELFIQIYTEQDMTQKRAELFSTSCFMPAVRDAISKSLGQNIVVDMKQSDLIGEYSTRNCFTGALLFYLKEKHDPKEYMQYISNFESFAKDWLCGRVVKHCETKTNGEVKLIQLAKVILKQITDEAKHVIRNVQNSSGEAKSFIDLFVEKLKTKLTMPKDILKLVTFQSDIKAEHFMKMVLSCIEQAEASLLKELIDWDVKAKIGELTIKPEEEILKKLIPCVKKCPFCKVSCEAEVLVDHQHFSNQHRPQGLSGYHCSETKLLVTNICTASVASDRRFQSSSTNNESVYYRDYKTVNDYYNSWIIQNSPGSEASSYWKMVFHEFNQQFAAHYDLEPAQIPASWDISWKQVKDDLTKTYHVSFQEWKSL